jgi:hypothetical protein
MIDRKRSVVAGDSVRLSRAGNHHRVKRANNPNGRTTKRAEKVFADECRNRFLDISRFLYSEMQWKCR